jgi:hypothetical protein
MLPGTMKNVNTGDEKCESGLKLVNQRAFSYQLLNNPVFAVRAVQKDFRC